MTDEASRHDRREGARFGEEYPRSDEMQVAMFEHVGVFRTEEGMRQAVEKVRELKERFKKVRVGDQGRVFNTDILEAWEVGCLLIGFAPTTRGGV